MTAACAEHSGQTAGGRHQPAAVRRVDIPKQQGGMRTLGIRTVVAWRSGTNGRGPWWNAGASHMHAAFPKSWFDRLGLVSLLDTVQRLQRVS